ncbi:MFS domain-containing protein [Mycena kentingensis (nom. inval.)]|nr:MFS domain-containing protein [Mycena kentingensis (nom. inval.)]
MPLDVTTATENSTLVEAKPEREDVGDETDLTEEPENGDAQTQQQRKTEYMQLVSLCGVLVVSGWVDGSLGPLIPEIQKFYGVSYTIVSLLFVFKCIGYISGAFVNILITRRFGFGNLVLAGSFILIIANGLQAAAPVVPYEVFVLGSLLNGFGLATQNSQSVGYVASLRVRQATKMGIFQSAYGLGCLTSPLVVTQFLSLARSGYWALSYLTAVVVAMINALSLWVVFRRRTQEECLAQIGQVELDFPQEKIPQSPLGVADAHAAVPTPAPTPAPPLTAFSVAQSQMYPPTPYPTQTLQKSTMRQVLSLKVVHLLALFLFAYVGTEVTIAGWIVTFVRDVRGGGNSSGYIASGFWAGFMVGRIALLPLNKWIGEHLATYIYLAVCIGLELIIWFVRNIYVDAVAVALIGTLFGPLFPIGMNLAARTIHPALLTPAISWLSGISFAGASVFPLIAGAIAGRAGFGSFQPVIIGMLVLMILLWALVPRERPYESVAPSPEATPKPGIHLRIVQSFGRLLR